MSHYSVLPKTIFSNFFTLLSAILLFADLFLVLCGLLLLHCLRFDPYYQESEFFPLCVSILMHFCFSLGSLLRELDRLSFPLALKRLIDNFCVPTFFFSGYVCRGLCLLRKHWIYEEKLKDIRHRPALESREGPKEEAPPQATAPSPTFSQQPPQLVDLAGSPYFAQPFNSRRFSIALPPPTRTITEESVAGHAASRARSASAQSRTAVGKLMFRFNSSLHHYLIRDGSIERIVIRYLSLNFIAALVFVVVVGVISEYSGGGCGSLNENVTKLPSYLISAALIFGLGPWTYFKVRHYEDSFGIIREIQLLLFVAIPSFFLILAWKIFRLNEVFGVSTTLILICSQLSISLVTTVVPWIQIIKRRRVEELASHQSKSSTPLEQERSLSQVMANPMEWEQLLKFSTTDFSSENLGFVMEVKKYRQLCEQYQDFFSTATVLVFSDGEGLVERAVSIIQRGDESFDVIHGSVSVIYNLYLKSSAVCEVNLNGDTKKDLVKAIREEKYHSKMFDTAEAEIMHLIQTNSFKRFRRYQSEHKAGGNFQPLSNRSFISN